MPDIFTVKVDDPDITFKKNSEIQEQLKPLIEQAIINKINEQQDTGVPTRDVGDLEELVNELVNSWYDDRATNAQHLIEYVKDYNGYDNKILDAFMDWWATEKVFYRVYNSNGEVYF